MNIRGRCPRCKGNLYDDWGAIKCLACSRVIVPDGAWLDAPQAIADFLILVATNEWDFKRKMREMEEIDGREVDEESLCQQGCAASGVGRS